MCFPCCTAEFGKDTFRWVFLGYKAMLRKTTKLTSYLRYAQAKLGCNYIPVTSFLHSVIFVINIGS